MIVISVLDISAEGPKCWAALAYQMTSGDSF